MKLNSLVVPVVVLLALAECASPAAAPPNKERPSVAATAPVLVAPENALCQESVQNVPQELVDKIHPQQKLTIKITDSDIAFVPKTESDKWDIKDLFGANRIVLSDQGLTLKYGSEANAGKATITSGLEKYQGAEITIPKLIRKLYDNVNAWEKATSSAYSEEGCKQVEKARALRDLGVKVWLTDTFDIKNEKGEKDGYTDLLLQAGIINGTHYVLGSAGGINQWEATISHPGQLDNYIQLSGIVPGLDQKIILTEKGMDLVDNNSWTMTYESQPHGIIEPQVSIDSNGLNIKFILNK